MEKLMLLTLLFLIIPGFGHGQCSNTSTNLQRNLRTLSDLLTKNAPLHDGFYSSSVGNQPDQVYGVSQCKANISSNDCANCLKSIFRAGKLGDELDECSEFTSGESMSTVCTTKLSNENIIGVWTNSSTATFGNNGLDNPSVFSKGYSMMQDLATTVPDQPLMYQAAQVNVGEDGKRYGLAQCGRDLSKLNCQNCLEDRLVRYKSFVENRTGWEILGTSCSMWYSNVSDAYIPDTSVTALTPSPQESQFPPGEPSATSGVQRYHGGIGTCTCVGIITFTILLAAHVFFLS